MTAQDLERFYDEIHALWETQTEAAAERIWQMRMEVGTTIPAFGQLDQRRRFWIMAYPVLAAEILRLDGRPVEASHFLIYLADFAVRIGDANNSSQRAALEVCQQALA